MTISRDAFLMSWRKVLENDGMVIRRVFPEVESDVYFGRNQKQEVAVFLPTGTKSNLPESTQNIRSEEIRLSDGRKFYSLSCTSDLFERIFMDLCFDLIVILPETLGKPPTSSSVIAGYIDWRELLGGLNSEMSISELRGMLTEVWFLSDVLMKVQKIESSIESWVGPIGAAHDFRLEQTLDIEIKSIGVSSADINIASEQQLDATGELELVVISYEAYSRAQLIAYIQRLLVDLWEKIAPQERSALSAKISRFVELYGIPSIANASPLSFEPRSINIFKVQGGFPRLIPSQLPPGVSKVRYQISLRELSDFKVPLTETSSPALQAIKHYSGRI